MVKNVKYHDFLSHNGIIVTVTNDQGQKWDLRRSGISSDEMREYIAENGMTEGVKTLIEEGKLIPIYGGDLHL